MEHVAIGLSIDLPKGRVMRAWVAGEERVVWRSAKGQLFAWDNRCPHRGMRLSHGFVRGESLACIYHGWHYGENGKCHYIPAHPSMTLHQSIGVTSHAIFEQQGILWISTGNEPRAPRIPAVGEDSQPLRTLSVECSSDVLLGYLADRDLTDENGAVLFASCDTQSPMIINYLSDDSAFRVSLLIQAVADNSANIHMLCSMHWSIPGRVHLSRWGDSIRRGAEAADAKRGPAR